MTKAQQDAAYAKHRMDQILHVARNTTARQRLDWLDQMVVLWHGSGIDRNERKDEARKRRRVRESNISCLELDLIEKGLPGVLDSDTGLVKDLPL